MNPSFLGGVVAPVNRGPLADHVVSEKSAERQSRAITIGWLIVTLIGLENAIFHRSDAAGEAMMAGCIHFLTAVPLLLVSIGALIAFRKDFSGFPGRLKTHMISNCLAYPVVFVVTSLAHEFFSPY